MRALAQEKWPLSQNRIPALFLSQNVSSTQEWVRPPTLVDLMRESQESSHPTVEIR
jgi:hypothetical protein